jgi:hypothetical protein
LIDCFWAKFDAGPERHDVFCYVFVSKTIKKIFDDFLTGMETGLKRSATLGNLRRSLFPVTLGNLHKARQPSPFSLPGYARSAAFTRLGNLHKARQPSQLSLPGKLNHVTLGYLHKARQPSQLPLPGTLNHVGETSGAKCEGCLVD